MNPFRKKPPKKKQKSSPSAPKALAVQKPRPEPWKPPYPPRSKPLAMERSEKAVEIPEAKAEQKYKLPRTNPRKEFLSLFRQLTNTHHSWDIWSDFVTMFACAISNSVDKEHFDEREKLYLKTIRKYTKQAQLIFPKLAACTVEALEQNPEQDFLGGMFMELGLGSKDKGQFFTPYTICQLMARVTLGNLIGQVEEKGYVSICDPCCGGGATLIAAANEAKWQLEKQNLNFQNHVLIVGQDIDFTAVMMSYIQLSLLGLAGYFKVGDIFTDPITENDSTENYWFTPMYFSDVWCYRRLYRGIGSLIKGDGKDS